MIHTETAVSKTLDDNTEQVKRQASLTTLRETDMPTRRDIERIKSLIMDKYAPGGRQFTMQDVYMDKSDPADLAMYEAFDELVNEGALKGKTTDDPSFYSHNDMKYRKAAQEIREQLIRIAYEQPEHRPALMPLIEKYAFVSEDETVEATTSKQASRPLVRDWKDLMVAQPNKIERWKEQSDQFALDFPEEGKQKGGKSWFPANAKGYLQDFDATYGDFMKRLKSGNNTTLLSRAVIKSYDATHTRWGRPAIITAMPPFDAQGLARDGVACYRLEDAYDIWICYVPTNP